MLSHRACSHVFAIFLKSYRLSFGVMAVSIAIILCVWLSSDTLLLKSSQARAAQTEEILLQGDFDQANSHSLGSRWNEVGEINKGFKGTINDLNFQTTPDPFTTGGRVITTVGAPVIGVVITFARLSGSGEIPAPVQTNNNGNWVRTGFRVGTTYRAIPLYAGYTFNPTGRDFFSGPINDLNFQHTNSIPNPQAMTGRVITSVGAAVGGVTITFLRVSGSGVAPPPVQTDSKGNWIQSGFQAAATYQVIPGKPGLIFSPAISNVPAPKTDVKFIGIPDPSVAQTEEILLQDNFDQPNWPILGSFWNQIGEVKSEFIGQNGALIGPGFMERWNGAITFHYRPHSQRTTYNSTNGRPTVYAPLSKAVSSFPATISFTMHPHLDARTVHSVGLMASRDGLSKITEIPGSPGLSHYVPINGIGIIVGRSGSNWFNSSVRVVRYDRGNPTTLAEKSLIFQFLGGFGYTFNVTINQDYSVRVDVKDVHQSLVDTIVSGPTNITFPLDQLFISDLDGGISFDTFGNTGDFRLLFDDVIVKQSPP